MNSHVILVVLYCFHALGTLCDYSNQYNDADLWFFRPPAEHETVAASLWHSAGPPLVRRVRFHALPADVCDEATCDRFAAWFEPVLVRWFQEELSANARSGRMSVVTLRDGAFQLLELRSTGRGF